MTDLIAQNLAKALQFMVDEDETRDQSGNKYWIIGLEFARKALADFNGVEYETIGWNTLSDDEILEGFHEFQS